MDRLISEKQVLDAIADFIKNNDSVAKLILNINAIPSAEPYKGMTNGKVIKAVFPDIPRTLEWHIQNVTDDDWWNSPYEPQESEDNK